MAASGLLTLPEGLMRSCNPYFWHIGLDLYDQGMEQMVSNMALGFGLGEVTGIEQIVEAPGDIPVPENQVDAVNFAIGQGATLVTPVQVARFVAAVGNGGKLLRPQVVESVEPPGGEAIYSFKKEVVGELSVSSETLSILQDAMRSVVENPKGTAYWRFINFSIPLAGKTGTAETPGDPHAWFAGYTFAEDPDYPDLAIAVILEHAGEGSQLAAPIFRRLVEVYFLGQPLIPLPWETELPSPPAG